MDVLADIGIPVASILVPTAIAIWLARAERKRGDESRYLERRRQAAEPVVLALAHFVSLDPLSEPMQPELRDLRGRIAVYRSSLRKSDLLSGDWLALRHVDGMRKWATAVDLIQESGGNPDAELIFNAVEPGHVWANETIELFSSWLAGVITDLDLQRDGARMLEQQRSDSISRSTAA
ncbi:hypothetical protein F1C15_11325 [Frigoribacterium sp. NBH87]|uniref:hypothetical protein n=1 Tax=Frigoribacterium sp. NBH87 TaxID=2596916 RepID=UPI0016275E8E|nr:hypothetical protein [Frigoribacterium sp. NBH87]QNE44322.1 hypothetical protein F1C15_11325 [Frigoribacterium sp. NBH87]